MEDTFSKNDDCPEGVCNPIQSSVRWAWLRSMEIATGTINCENLMVTDENYDQAIKYVPSKKLALSDCDSVVEKQ